MHRPLVVGLCVLLTAAPWAATQAEAAPAPSASVTVATTYAKYLVVTADGGRVPQLREIALRVLGDQRRSEEILTLNRGRGQPDGSALTETGTLRAGWILVLPWDAVGVDVRNGQVPQFAASPAPTGTRRPVTDATVCTLPAPHKVDGLPWAQLRLAPEAAWDRSKGDGVTVAVLDSGVDATVPALAGRVLPGVDAESGGLADTDCTGHGTATAGIVAAATQPGTSFAGLAPEAMILPIRVPFTAEIADTAALLTALKIAVAQGARVAMVGGAVDLSDQAVVDALRTAVAAGTTVVIGAVPSSVSGSRGVPAGILRVGAVGADDILAGEHPDGTVDVVAPGVDVVSLGASGSGEVEVSGTGFAVPFVAGTAALLAASDPGISPALIVERITGTADGAAGGRRDPVYGWGLINPAAALSADQGPDTNRMSIRSISSATALAIGVAALVAFLILSLRGSTPSRRRSGSL